MKKLFILSLFLLSAMSISWAAAKEEKSEEPVKDAGEQADQQTGEGSGEEKTDGMPAYDWGLSGIRFWKDYIPSGADLWLKIYTDPGSTEDQSYFWFFLGGGYESFELYRDPVTGDPAGTPQTYDGVDVRFDFGYCWPATVLFSLLTETILLVRGEFVENFLSSPIPAFPDAEGYLSLGFIYGLNVSILEKSSHGIYSGFAFFLSLEVIFTAPTDGFSTIFFSEYLTSTLSFFIPIFDIDSRMNILSAYLACNLSLSNVYEETGGPSPISVNQSFGGKNVHKSLGYCVRGYPESSFDSITKIVANIEMRINLPAVWYESLYPIITVFLDVGYYSGWSGATTDIGSGSIASTGASIAVNFFNLGQFGVILGTTLVPAYTGDPGFFWKLTMSCHF